MLERVDLWLSCDCSLLWYVVFSAPSLLVPSWLERVPLRLELRLEGREEEAAFDLDSLCEPEEVPDLLAPDVVGCGVGGLEVETPGTDSVPPRPESPLVDPLAEAGLLRLSPVLGCADC